MTNEQPSSAVDMTNALGAGDPIGALRIALGAWRAHRSDVISAAIAAVSREVARTSPPPEERTSKGFDAAWRTAAEDDCLRPWLLEKLTDLLPGRDSEAKSNSLAARLRILGRLEPDPRVASALVALFERQPPMVGFTDIANAMAKLIVANADDSVRAPLTRLAETSKQHATYRKILARLKPSVPLTDAEKAVWTSAFPARTENSDAIDAMVRESPVDDGPRQVLSDWLQERDEPRGEFIALQLREAAGEATESDMDRAAELLRTHRVAWLGKLARIVHRAELRRGFLARLELAGSWSANAAGWAECANDPLLATVEELEPAEAPDDIYALFLRSPALSALRCVTIGSDVAMDALVARPPPRLDHVRCLRWKRADALKRFLERVLPFVESTPGVTTLGVNDDMLASVNPALLARLRHLEVSLQLSDAPKLWKSLPDHLNLTVLDSPAVELSRGPKGTVASLSGPTFFKGIAPGIARALTKLAVTNVRVVGNQKLAAELAAELPKKIPVTSVRPPSGIVTGLKT